MRHLQGPEKQWKREWSRGMIAASVGTLESPSTVQCWCWQQVFLCRLCKSLQHSGWVLGCWCPQRHCSLVICTQAKKFQVSSGKPSLHLELHDSVGVNWKAEYMGPLKYFGNTSWVLDTWDGREVNKQHICSENLLCIYTCPISLWKSITLTMNIQRLLDLMTSLEEESWK